MKFENDTAEFFVPDSISIKDALERTTHMGIGARPDDLEIMAYHGILECFMDEKKWFLGVTITDSAGSPRDDLYASYSDEDMRKVRRVEQKKAAVVGEYGGKRYDLAILGRRRANATYYESHGTDITSAMIYAIDLTPLIKEPRLDITEFTAKHIDRFRQEVSTRLRKLLSTSSK